MKFGPANAAPIPAKGEDAVLWELADRSGLRLAGIICVFILSRYYFCVKNNLFFVLADREPARWADENSFGVRLGVAFDLVLEHVFLLGVF